MTMLSSNNVLDEQLGREWLNSSDQSPESLDRVKRVVRRSKLHFPQNLRTVRKVFQSAIWIIYRLEKMHLCPEKMYEYMYIKRLLFLAF